MYCPRRALWLDGGDGSAAVAVGTTVVVPALGVVHLVGVLLLGLLGTAQVLHVAEERASATDAVRAALAARALDLGLLAGAFVGHGNHHSFGLCDTCR